MIPKIVHYCWFGGKPLQGIVKSCVKTFDKIGEKKEWNESNCSFIENKYVMDAVKDNGFAYLSDYYRLKVLYEYGGIYLDTDIEVKKKLEPLFFDYDLVLGYMYDCYISTAFIMARPRHPFIKKLLDKYETMDYNPNYANNYLITMTLLETYPQLKLNGKTCEFDERCILFAKEYFEAPILFGEGGYCVHHFTGYWKKQPNILYKVLRPFIKKFLYHCHPINVLYNKCGRKKALLTNPCYQRYLIDKDSK